MYDDKTKRSGYTPIELLSSNIGSDVAKRLRTQATGSSSRVTTGPSTLDPTIQNLIKTLYEEAS